jgi:protein-S-isoprenylcysteine O-methyltransferase Ste14
MPSLIPTLRWITIILWLIWLVMFWNDGWQSMVEVQKSKVRVESLSGTLIPVAIALLTLLIIATGLLITSGFPKNIPSLLSLAVIISGITLTLFGMGGTLYCRYDLERFWTEESSKQAHQHGAHRGPYGLVRHPIYITTILFYTGTVMVFPTWWNMIAGLLVVLAYIYKTREEEHFLAKNLPGYRDYQKRIPYRLIPRIW